VTQESLRRQIGMVTQETAMFNRTARENIIYGNPAATETQMIAAAQAAYDAVSAEAELGSRTTLDVLDAEQDLLDARSARIQAAANVQTAAYALLESTGQMTVRSLGLGIATYDVEAYSSGFNPGPAPVTSVQGRRLDRIMERYQGSDGP